ncbi:YbaB/EbfC family nucleoid-associated protein [Nocardia sp. NPDC023852]|uniref:YbaB/EbfC family nucleoid-associated protein n=1 Tax=Nocardia sp. NPDC023852 TaxID=3154697 RepID=UPI00340E02BE
MDRWKREGLRSANSGLRNQVEHLLDAYEAQKPRLTEVYRQLEAFRLRASSPDQSVEVTVDASGVLTDLTLTASAMRKTPGELARFIVEAVREAAVRAREHNEAIAAPVAADLDDMPDLPDIMSETPSLHDIRAFLRGDQNPAD